VLLVDRQKSFLTLSLLEDSAQLSWVRSGQILQHAAVPLTPDARDLSDLSWLRALLRQVQSWGIQGAGALKVGLGVSWCQVGVVPWSPQLLDPSIAAAVVRQHFHEQGWQTSESDEVRVQLQRFEEPVLAVCYPGALIEAVRAMASELRLQLASVQSLSLLAWAHANKAEPGAVVDGRSVWLVRGWPQLAESHFAWLSSDDPEALSRAWRRQCSRSARWEAALQPWAVHLHAPHTAEMNQAQHLLTSSFADARLQALDVCSKHNRKAMAAVMAFLAVTALALLGLLNGHWMDVQASNVARQTSEMSATRHEPAVQAGLNVSPQQMRELAAIRANIEALNVPLDGLLMAVQPPRDLPVVLMALNLAADTKHRAMRLEAEVEEPQDMVRYMTFLQDRSLLGEPRLMQHQRITRPEGARHRFVLEVPWRAQ
jgi:hypothetical protein